MFDICFNIVSSQFSKDRDKVVKRAFASGVNGLLLTGTSQRNSEQALCLAQNYVNCWSTVGIHPHNSKEWNTKSAESVYMLAKALKVVAIGECGLDFNRQFSTMTQQENAFTEQLAIASELEMPVFLHCRDAHTRFTALLEPWLDKLPGVVLHCFTGSREEARDYLNYGLYLGITGWVCDERRGLALRKILPIIPVNQLLFETDSPYLLPHKNFLKLSSSRRNEPAYLGYIIENVARWRGEDRFWLEEKSDENVRRLFRIAF